MNMLIYGILLIFLSILLLLINLYMIMIQKIIILEWMIYQFNSMKFNMFLLIDEFMLNFMMLILIITSMVVIYSLTYMNMELNLMKRFYLLLMLFVMSMCLMIISPNMLTILLGWDGLGLISYCLVIFYQNLNSYNAGMLTVILNRIGDASLLMLICLMMSFGSWNLLLYKMNNYMLFLMIIMTFTKSAQLPFCSWLPAAMMAPTPISALVHSSTLVTAGVYMLIRYNNLLSLSLNKLILLISSLTMLMAGMIANFEMDFKKIIALSTLSQLGFMMSILSMKLIYMAYLHMIIHAMFKSLMFLCVGSYIFMMNGSQNLQNYGGMFKIYSFKNFIMMFSLLSLCGFPFLVGFYSKDLIMEEFFFLKLNMLSLFNLMLGTMFTVSYSFRLIIMVFTLNYLKFKLLNYNKDFKMNMCMFILMIISMIYSKMYFNMKFLDLNLMLDMLMKLMVLKLIILGMIFNKWIMQYLKYFYMNYYMIMFNSMMFLNNFYKYIYLNPLLMLSKYDLIIEKNLMENFMSMLFILFKYFNFKYYMNLLNMLIFFMFIIMIYLI
uniref:NADH:ubiquinone reductase (H(+)-translocating) n=1 Tax=Eucera floralia TaxID=599063 RepID=A0A343DRI6_9HYME|nr:NADH dehydrogenase subunit 5 [Eucera floralia]